MATTWCVSNKASNGYALGSDTNTGLTRGSPFLTINKALSVNASGDSVHINPSGTDYIENVSTTGVTFGNPVAYFGGDPTLLAVGVPLIKPLVGTSNRWGNIGASASAFNLSNFIFDGANVTSGLATGAMTVAGLTYTNVTFRNITGSAGAAGPSGNNSIFRFIKCTAESSVGNLIRAADYESIIIKGGTYSCQITATTFPNTNALDSFLITQSDDGQRCTINGYGIDPIQITGVGTIGTIEIDHTDFVNVFAGLDVKANIATSISQILFHDNTSSGICANQKATVYINNATCPDIQIYNNTCSAAAGLVNIPSELVTNAIIRDNVVNLPANAVGDCMGVNCGTGLQIYNNTLNIAATGSLHAVLVGSDGFVTGASNTTSTGTQNLGDITDNTYVDQAFTTAALTVAGRTSYSAGFTVSLSKAGTLDGTVTAYLYDDSASAPANLLETSTTSVANAALTGTAQTFYFEFTSHTVLTAATVYHIVLKYNGTVDGVNYVKVNRNATVSGGVLSTSPDGTAWTANPALALIYAYLSCMGATDAKVYDNTINCTSPASAQMHGLMLGSTLGGKAYGNLIFGTSIPLICKDGFAASFYGNLVYTSAGSNQACFYNKSGQNTNFYNNTLICASATEASFEIAPDSSLSVNITSGSGNFKNNILIQSASGTNYIYKVVANTLGTYPDSGITIDYNVVYNSGSNAIDSERYSTWGAWQGAGFDTHSFNSDPLLTDQTTPTEMADFIPSFSSPAYHAGLSLNVSYPDVKDYRGHRYGNPPTIGGYEFTSYSIANTRTASTGGPYGRSAQFSSINSQRLSIASNATLQAPSTSLTVAGWFYFDTISGDIGLVGKGTFNNVAGEYYLYVRNSAIMRFEIGNGTAQSICATSFSTTGAWTFVAGRLDTGNQLVRLRVNATNITPVASTSTIQSASGTFSIGGISNAFLNGRADSVGLWKRHLTDDELTWLYNEGSGKVYNDLGSSGTIGGNLKTSLVSWYELDEPSGTRSDSFGTNHLTASTAVIISNSPATLNGGFETAGGGGADVFANWTEAVASTTTIADEGVIVHSGSHACAISVNVTNDPGSIAQTVLVQGHVYSYSLWAIYVGVSATITVGGVTTIYSTHTVTTSYAQYSGTFTAVDTTFKIKTGEAASTIVYIDDVVLNDMGPVSALGVAHEKPTTRTVATTRTVRTL